MPKPTPQQRLGEAVRAARQAQRQTQRFAAGLGGISPLTWMAAEKGEKVPRELTLVGIERGLGWAPGTAKAVMAGADPPDPGAIPASSTTAPGPPEDRLDRLEGKLDAIARHLGVKYEDDRGA